MSGRRAMTLTAPTVGRALPHPRPRLGQRAQPLGRAGGRRPAARHRARPGLRRGPQRGLAGRARLAGHRRRTSRPSAWRRAASSSSTHPARRRSPGSWPTRRRYRRAATGRPRAALLPAARPRPQRRAAVRAAAAALAPGGTLLVIGHDSRNLTDGTGGPQDPAVLFTAADIAADLAGSGLRDREGRRGVAAGRGRRPAGDRRPAARAPAYSALIAASQAAGSRPSPGPFISAKRTMPSLSTRNVPRLAMPAFSLNDAVGLRHRRRAARSRTAAGTRSPRARRRSCASTTSRR